MLPSEKSPCCSPAKSANRLIDIDALGLVARSLGDHHAQDAVLQARLDRILIDAGGEAECTMEFPDRALRDPVLGAANTFLPLLLALLRNHLSALLHLLGGLVLHRRLVALARIGHVPRDASVGFVGSFGGILALGAAFDDEGVGVGELDVHVLLLDAGEFALEFIGGLVLADVEFGLEGADGGVGGEGAGVAVGGVVVEEAEEGSHFGVGEAGEERHC